MDEFSMNGGEDVELESDVTQAQIDDFVDALLSNAEKELALEADESDLAAEMIGGDLDFGIIGDWLKHRQEMKEIKAKGKYGLTTNVKNLIKWLVILAVLLGGAYFVFRVKAGRALRW